MLVNTINPGWDRAVVAMGQPVPPTTTSLNTLPVPARPALLQKQFFLPFHTPDRLQLTSCPPRAHFQPSLSPRRWGDAQQDGDEMAAPGGQRQPWELLQLQPIYFLQLYIFSIAAQPHPYLCNTGLLWAALVGGRGCKSNVVSEGALFAPG